MVLQQCRYTFMYLEDTILYAFHGVLKEYREKTT